MHMKAMAFARDCRNRARQSEPSLKRLGFFAAPGGADILLLPECIAGTIAVQRDHGGASMVRPTNKVSDTERELRAYSDELGIRRHAERLEADLGTDRVLKVLEELARAIAARRPPVPLVVVTPVHK